MTRYLRLASVGSPAARSALLTVLGEYVAPRSLTVYREAYVAALETLGFGATAARQALSRSIAAGWLVSQRLGRRSLMKISDETTHVLSSGYPRIYRFGEDWRWTGKWLVVIVRVPESKREVRDRLRTQMAWAGFGSLGGGVWVSPHLDRDEEVSSLDDGQSVALLSLIAEGARIGSADDIVNRAWDLNLVGDHYHSFLSDFAKLQPTEPADVFAALTAMVHAWRKFPFIDPDLPQELLPPGWPRTEARELFSDRHARWTAAATEYFDGLGE